MRWRSALGLVLSFLFAPHCLPWDEEQRGHFSVVLRATVSHALPSPGRSFSETPLPPGAHHLCHRSLLKSPTLSKAAPPPLPLYRTPRFTGGCLPKSLLPRSWRKKGVFLPPGAREQVLKYSAISFPTALWGIPCHMVTASL